MQTVPFQLGLFYAPENNEEYEAYLLILRSSSSFLDLFHQSSTDSAQRSIFIHFIRKVGDFLWVQYIYAVVSRRILCSSAFGKK
jgi:hypothetical protein